VYDFRNIRLPAERVPRDSFSVYIGVCKRYLAKNYVDNSSGIESPAPGDSSPDEPAKPFTPVQFRAWPPGFFCKESLGFPSVKCSLTLLGHGDAVFP
jgi:hypothetical protein